MQSIYDTLLYLYRMSSARELIAWNALRPILYPWIGEEDPYRILISEFLLQQTRSDQALPYYHRMLKAFPSIRALAEADEDRPDEGVAGSGLL